MRLSDVIRGVPGARLATPEDDPRVLAFFDESPMGTARFEIAYRRSPEFFRLLRYQADRAFVFLSEGDDARVRGIGSLSVRPGWVDGEPAQVGYLGDLRIAHDRRLLVHWRRAYAELVTRAAELDELGGPTHFVTAVMDENALARAALVRRRRDGPVYLPLSSFRMRTIVARRPWARRRAHPLVARPAVPSDLPAMSALFEARQRARLFGYRGDLERRLRVWDDLGLHRFYVVEDRAGALHGMTAVWAPTRAKTTLVSRLPPELAVAGAIARVLPGVPMVRLPRAGEPLRIGYLTCLELEGSLGARDREHALGALLDEVHRVERRKPWHGLALPEHEGFSLGRALDPFVTNDVPISLYTVHPPGTTRAPYDAPRSEPPAFEMALV